MTDAKANVVVLSDEGPTRIEELQLPGVLDGTVRIIYDEDDRASLDVSFYRGYLRGESPDTPIEDVDDYVVGGANIDLPHHKDVQLPGNEIEKVGGENVDASQEDDDG